MGIGDSEIPRSPVETSELDRDALPQYGFGSDVGFEQLIDSNPFLFRLHTPKETSPFYDNSEPFFVGQAFNDGVNDAAFCASNVSPYRPPSTYKYADVAKHMEWTTRASSPFVSASFSFAWAIWEATRRYHHGMKHSIQIAVIDAKALSGKAVTAVELLRQGPSQDRHKDHWKWYRYASESQDVLVWGYIPGTAVLASIPLTQILPRLPSYFLAPDPSHVKDTPISRVGWAYDQKKYNYRTFCQDMSEHFLRLPIDRRMRDTSAGAVRLAIALLRPWFHRLATEDFATATATACELAQQVARWPGLWWVREHPETRDLIRCLVHIVGEEAREARRTQALADATRMQDIVGGLEHLARSFQSAGTHSRHRSLSTSFSIPSVSSTASVMDEDETMVDPEMILKAGRAAADRKPFPMSTILPTPLPTPEASLRRMPPLVPGIEDPVFSPPEQPQASTSRAAEKAKAKDETPLASPASPSVSSRIASAVGSMFGTATHVVGSTVQPVDSTRDYYARTASAFLTGFFLGTFFTLCVLSPHRREIANHFT